MIRKYIISIITILTFLSCENPVPVFDSQRAFLDLLAQCEFGPRNPGSEGHRNTKKYIIDLMQKEADSVIVQDFSFESALEKKTRNGSNIIARFDPSNKMQVLIGAHWDTRPFADRDENRENYNTPILGAPKIGVL